MQSLQSLKLDKILLSSIEKCIDVAKPILDQIVVRFPSYTNHNIVHSEKVLSICHYFIDDISNLSEDERYILAVAAILHDIGMAVSDEQLKLFCNKHKIDYSDNITNEQQQEIIRENHHTLTRCAR